MIEHAIPPSPTRTPRHVAIIMGGTHRWAQERGLEPIEGHRAGLEALLRTVEAAREARIEVLTAGVLAEESWELLAPFADRLAPVLAAGKIRLRLLGRADRLPEAARMALRGLIEATQAHDGLRLNLAIDYSARDELLEMVRAVARDVARGTVRVGEVNEQLLGTYLCTADLPDPDLVIRTGGALKLANFLLYQAAYSELWATRHHWPAFDATTLDEAIVAYGKRNRRFGG